MSNEIKVNAELDDLLFVFGAALRYGLGRRTYATGLISEFIADNSSLINKKWQENYIQEIERYEKDRGDDECDYRHWMKLKNLLKNHKIGDGK